jgi:hypothetical protein
MTGQSPDPPSRTMTRQEHIAALIRQMLRSDAGAASAPAVPLRTIATPQEAAIIAAVIDRLPPEGFAGSDRNRVKLDYLLRSLGADPTHAPRPPAP